MRRGRNRVPLEERFWEKVKKSDHGCWEWTACKVFGYGKIGLGSGNGSAQAHRVSWEIHFGPIPNGLHVCHRCDNPGCVRPDHLFLGTAADNMRDMTTKGRRALGPKMRSPLTAEAVSEIVSRVRAGEEQKRLATEYGVSRATVCRIANGLRWAHVSAV